MSIPWLLDGHPFPKPHEANEDGIVAVGGTLSKERLIEAYASGIFPITPRRTAFTLVFTRSSFCDSFVSCANPSFPAKAA